MRVKAPSARRCSDLILGRVVARLGEDEEASATAAEATRATAAEAANAAAICPVKIANGKFQGLMQVKTPASASESTSDWHA